MFKVRKISCWQNCQHAHAKASHFPCVTAILSKCVSIRWFFRSHGGKNPKKNYLENLVYHFFRQLWLVLGVKLLEINSNWFSKYWRNKAHQTTTSFNLNKKTHVVQTNTLKHVREITCFENHLENIVYHNFRQLWLVLGVKLMEINSNLFSRHLRLFWLLLVSF